MGKESNSRGFFGWFLVLVILDLAVGAVVYIIKKKLDHGNDNKPTPVPDPPGAIDHRGGDCFVAAGRLVDNKISWREDSALTDGSEAKLDLSKGMYDAGDHVKFGFPMAFTATVLSWAILEYRDQMEAVNQLEPAQQSLKWITDFLLNAHPSQNVLYIQVGDPVTDYKCWDRPEDMTEKRPLTQVNASVPGTEVAAETAAAMASASLVFKTADSTYSSTLLTHAKQLFTFEDNNRGSYSEKIPEVATYYNSIGYGDELLWAASWLFHATADQSYLEYVTGTQVLLSRLSFFGASGNSVIENYRKSAEDVMCGLLPKSPTATSSRTASGLIWVSEWNSLQHPVASAFLAALYGDYMLTTQTAKLTCGGHSFEPSDLRKFAKSQADYVLGSNPLKMSFLVGYGDKYPQYVHHRGASIPVDATTGCTDGLQWLNSTKSNPNVAVGALVEGPFLNETFVDSRNNTMQTEPTTYNSAVIVGLLSSLVTTSSAVKSFG
ncbi:endoglucanase 2-like [Gossypium australe]|uniref:Endoglucanase n=1 Tax=Gossypium australe TaxID=47621 RepID=A0A5B6VDA2_9ROSI|nr:endoglucanase 2-like [Gossypium australe]